MKFCKKCGYKLDDNTSFCEECGSKQDVSSAVMKCQNVNGTKEKLSNYCTPAKREIEDWALILLLVIGSPYIAEKIAVCFPLVIEAILYFGLPALAIGTMWKSSNWKLFTKRIVIGVYVLMYFL